MFSAGLFLVNVLALYYAFLLEYMALNAGLVFLPDDAALGLYRLESDGEPLDASWD